MNAPKKTEHPNDSGACYASALRVLGARWHSRRELEQKLARRGFASSAVSATLERLEREKWIDDTRFAHEYVLSKARKAIPKRRIEIELEGLGIDAEVARQAIAEGFDDDANRERLLAIGRRKAEAIARRHGNASLHGEVGRRKLSGALLRRGYDASAVMDAVDQILNERPNED